MRTYVREAVLGALGLTILPYFVVCESSEKCVLACHINRHNISKQSLSIQRVDL